MGEPDTVLHRRLNEYINQMTKAVMALLQAIAIPFSAFYRRDSEKRHEQPNSPVRSTARKGEKPVNFETRIPDPNAGSPEFYGERTPSLSFATPHGAWVTLGAIRKEVPCLCQCRARNPTSVTRR